MPFRFVNTRAGSAAPGGRRQQAASGGRRSVDANVKNRRPACGHNSRSASTATDDDVIFVARAWPTEHNRCFGIREVAYFLPERDASVIDNRTYFFSILTIII